MPSPFCTYVVHVHGFDKEGHAVVIYTPTVDSACPIETSVQFLVYNLERALALGAKGAGPGGQKVAQYTFIVDLSATGTVTNMDRGALSRQSLLFT